MHVAGNTQFSFAHIAKAEWQDKTMDAPDPRDGQVKPWHYFSLHMSNGNVENQLFETEQERKDAWDTLIDSMEAAGY